MVQRLSRRIFLRTAVLGGAGLLLAQLLGCEDEEARPSPSATEQASPETPRPEATSAPTTPPAAGSPRWQPIPPASPAPPVRREHLSLSDGTRLYVVGGRSGGAPIQDSWSYDPAHNRWTEIPTPEAMAARFGHNGVFDAAGNRLVVFGGQGQGFFNDLWTLDLTSGQWSGPAQAAPAPSPRYGAAAALDPAGRLLVSHGFTDQGRFDDSWALALDNDAWSDLSTQLPRPVERCLMRGAWDPGTAQFLMFGGQTTGTPFLGDLWALKDGVWREITAEPKPSPRNFYAMAPDPVGHRLILFGGNTADGLMNDLWFFDTAAESWSQASPEGEAPAARAGHDAVWLAGSRRLIVFGGQTEGGDTNELWELVVPA